MLMKEKRQETIAWISLSKDDAEVFADGLDSARCSGI